MEKKIRKPHKLLPDQVDPPSHAVRLGAETSRLPQPLQAAVDATSRWGVPRSLRDELAISILARPTDDKELAAVMAALMRLPDPDNPTRHSESDAPSSSLSPEEWQDRAHARASEVTAEAQSHRFLGLWLKNEPMAWQGLRNSLREAIEAFAGHQGDQRRERFEPEFGGCDWQWLFPPEPNGEKDLHGRPAFEEPMNRALWSWIRHGDVSPTIQQDRLSKRQIGKRITALRDTILGDCSKSSDSLRIRKSGLLQILAESFRQNSSGRWELVMAHSLERADGIRIDPRNPVKLPMALIVPLLAGESLEKAGIEPNRRTHGNTDLYSRMYKIRCKQNPSG